MRVKLPKDEKPELQLSLLPSDSELFSLSRRVEPRRPRREERRRVDDQRLFETEEDRGEAPKSATVQDDEFVTSSFRIWDESSCFEWEPRSKSPLGSIQLSQPFPAYGNEPKTETPRVVSKSLPKACLVQSPVLINRS